MLRRSAPLVAALALLGAGCGSDDEPEATSPQATAPAATAPPSTTATDRAGQRKGKSRAPGRARNCGKVNAKKGNIEATASDIRATNISCKAAQKFLRKRIRTQGKKPAGWRSTTEGNRLVFRKGKVVISVVPAGAGFS